MIDTSLSSLVLPSFSPRDYQSEAALFLAERPRAMLVKDPGMGKSGTSLMALDLLTVTGSQPFPALILAPKRVADVVWLEERNKWSTFQHLNMVQIVGTEAERRDILKRPTADVYVCNYELVPWLVGLWPQNRWPFRTVIADECSKLKGFRLNKGTVRSSALADIAQVTERWWNLTGTPMPNGYIDLWGQMYFVDFGARLKRSFTAYKEAFFIENRYTHKITLQLGAAEAIQELVKDVLVAYRSQDWLSIKEPQIIPVKFRLPSKAQEQYRTMEREYFLSLTDKDIEAGTAVAKGIKLLQMCSGSVYDDVGTAHHIHDAKIEALQDIVEQSGGEPLIVTYWWKFDKDRILEAFPDARVYSGGREQEDFNAGKIKMLLLHEQSAYGISLHHGGRDVVFYSYAYGAELRQQMIERCGPARQAQAGYNRVVRVWDISAAGTIEEDVLESNAGKISIEAALKRARARVRSGAAM